MEFPTPQAEHRWLQRMVGRWRGQAECVMGPGQEPQSSTLTETVRMLGDLWVIAESEGWMPDGGTSGMIMTLGFDPQRLRFVGTAAVSMMTTLWVYDGRLDQASDTLTLDTEGPHFSDPARRGKYQDVITLHATGRRVMTSSTLSDDGAWQQFMRVEYERIG